MAIEEKNLSFTITVRDKAIPLQARQTLGAPGVWGFQNF